MLFRSISREFREELLFDLGLNDPVVTKEIPKCRRLKKVEEGPFHVKPRGYVQYRRLDIFELISSELYSKEIVRYLVKAAQHNPHMAWVTVEEMKVRRTNENDVIGSYCGYLFGSQRTDGEDVHY